MPAMKTPGVYIVEKSAFPNSVVEVATAVPAFIGYTEKADNMGKSLDNTPWRITSMADFHKYFGFGPKPMFEIGVEEQKADEGEEKNAQGKKEKTESKSDESTDKPGKTERITFAFDGKDYHLTQSSGKYLLYYCMLMFYQNGGGPCYIVSVGNYSDSGNNIEFDPLNKGIETLVKEQEPTMVVIPDSMLLKKDDCINLQQMALAHCGGKMKNRVAILDVWQGYKDRQDPSGDCIAKFRNGLGINYLDYATAYFPWVNTTIVQDRELSFGNINNPDKLQAFLMEELGLQDIDPEVKDDDPPALITAKAKRKNIDDIAKEWEKEDPQKTPEDIETAKSMLNKSLVAMSPLFNNFLAEIKNWLNLLPPAAAMAGIYTMVDNSRGVWKAPANVSLNAVVSPAVNITHDEQEDLNVTPMGKSVNAIRTFIGEGTLVWGARTLDGNSLDWRYINVRRTMIMLEESIKLAAKAYVFEDNVGTTWSTIKSMIRNFLTGIWKRGGLAGAVPDDAFGVFVGLGETMTPEDILEGILRVTVLVAMVRPAEFIEITFQQQMQKS